MFRRTRHLLRAAGSGVGELLAELPAARDPAVRQYFSSRWNWFFLFAALVMYSVAWPTLPMTHDLPGFALPVVAAFAAWPLAFAWAAPVQAWGVSVVSAQVIGVVVPAANDWPWGIGVPHLIVLLVVTFCALARGPLRWLPVIWLATAVVLFTVAPPEARAGWVFGISVMAVVVALMRALVRSRRLLAQRTEETELAESQKAILTERTRIARDLHDIVAHRMSVVVVMAQTARYRIDGVDAAVAEEFDAIADAARSALDEVRQMLGVLRLDAEASSAPSPGLAELESLVAATRRAGAEVTMTDRLDHARVGDASALVVYRVVQESLANATRHAPGASIEVSLDQVGDRVEVSVVNEAPVRDVVTLNGPGSGIPGMVERVRAVGGNLIAVPRTAGGFQVTAVLPARAPSTQVTEVEVASVRGPL